MGQIDRKLLNLIKQILCHWNIPGSGETLGINEEDVLAGLKYDRQADTPPWRHFRLRCWSVHLCLRVDENGYRGNSHS